MTILEIRFRTNAECSEALREIDNGMFCPTTRELHEGDDLIVELAAPALPNKLLMKGTVVSWRPALPRRRVRAGATVRFQQDELRKLDFLQKVLAKGAVDVHKRRHLRLPVALPTRFRHNESPEWSSSRMLELSPGGGLLATDEPVALDSALLLEIDLPGQASPVQLQSSVVYHADNNTGLQFEIRDPVAQRRVKELVKRLREQQ